METRANYVAVGAFVLAIMLSIFVTVLWLAHTQFREEFKLYDTYFRGSVAGLGKGAQVRLNGIEIGRVTDLAIDPNDNRQVVATLQISGNTIITQDMTASLESQGLTGVSYVELAAGVPGSPALVAKVGERYPIIASRPSAFQQVVSGAPEVLTKLILIADRVTSLLDESNVSSIRDTLANLKTVTGAVAERSNDIDAMLGDGAKAAKALAAASASLDRTLAQLQGTLKTADNVGDKLDTLAASANVTLKNVDKLVGDVDKVVGESRPQIREFTQAGLSQLTQLLSETRTLVAGLTRVSNELERDPTRFLFGDRREGYNPR